jgi:hypothetical protein
VVPVLAGQRGFQGITDLYWAAVLASKRVRPWVLKFGGRAHRARGSSTTIAKFRSRPEEGSRFTYSHASRVRARVVALMMAPAAGAR